MRILFLMILVLSTAVHAEDVNNCKILFPNTADANSKYCHKSFGITYKGFLAFDRCFESLMEAELEMKNIKSCHKDDVIGNCQISNPKRKDRNSSYCTGTQFGFNYRGYAAVPECFDSIDKAFAAMESAVSCNKEDVLNNCKILKPNVYDNNRSYCTGTSFGVTYKGYLVSRSACYKTLDEAMAVMESIPSCVETSPNF